MAKPQPSLLSYDRLKSATLDQLKTDEQLRGVYSKFRRTNVDSLIGHYSSGYRDFSKDLSYALNNKINAGLTSGHSASVARSLEKYGNWNSPTADPATKAAAARAREEGLSRLKAYEDKMRTYGIDPSTIPGVAEAYKSFGVSAGGGLTAEATANKPWAQNAQNPVLVPQAAQPAVPAATPNAAPPSNGTSLPTYDSPEAASRIPFKRDLSPEQRQSIANLVFSKPAAQWTDIDKANWNYATGNAPLPQDGAGGYSIAAKLTPAVGTVVSPDAVGYEIPFRADLSPAVDKKSIENLVANKPVSQWTEADKKNWNYATNNAPLPTPPRMEGESIAAYTERIAGDTAVDGSKVKTSDAIREERRQQILNEITPDGALPEAPSLAEERIRLRREQGILSDEQDLADLRAEYRAVQEELRMFRPTAGQGMSEAGRIGAVSEAERNAMFRAEGLALREQALVERINAKNSFINQTIQDKVYDYSTAMQRWNAEYSVNLQATSLLNQQLDQEKKDALATATTIFNLMSESGVPYDEWSPEMKMASESAALALGLPKDTFAAAYANLGQEEKIVSTSIQPNEQGGLDAWVVTQGAKGEFGLTKVGTLTGAVAGSNDSDFYQRVALGLQLSEHYGDESYLNAALGVGGSSGGGGVPVSRNIFADPTPVAAAGSDAGGNTAQLRTVRNNNPIAFSAPYGGTNEYTDAVDRAGIDWMWEQGANFGNNATIKFATPEEGWEAARAVLADSPAIDQWYINRAKENPLYRKALQGNGITNKAQFAAASPEVQDKVIGGLFLAENGWNGAAPSAPTASTVERPSPTKIASSSVSAVPSSSRVKESQTQPVKQPFDDPNYNWIDFADIPSQAQKEYFNSRIKEYNDAIDKGTATKQDAFEDLHSSEFKSIRPSEIWDRLHDEPGLNPKVKAALAELDELEQEVQAYYNLYTEVVKKEGPGGPLVGLFRDWMEGTGAGFRLFGQDIKIPPVLASLAPHMNQLFNSQDTLAAKLGQSILQPVGAASGGSSRSPTYYRDLGASLVPSYKDPLPVANQKFADVKKRIEQRRRHILESNYAGSDVIIQQAD